MAASSAVEHEPERELVGVTLDGRYKLLGVLGQGGMGTVFEAEHLGLARRVAIKVLRASQAKKRVAVKRFEREARVARALSHPNICEVSDVGRLADGRPFLVMEKLVGSTLAQRLAAERVLPLADVVDLASQMLAGLKAAHEVGIVHRDLKPDNVFLARTGEGTVAKLLDFGVSKVIQENASAATDDGLELTRTGMVMGTPHYMAPEQARGDRNLDGRVDVFACGVVMYEALTGTRPFSGQTNQELLLAIIHTSPRPIRELNPSILPEVEAIVARAMAPDPADRYRSAREMHTALIGQPEPRGQLDSFSAALPTETDLADPTDVMTMTIPMVLPDLTPRSNAPPKGGRSSRPR